MQKRLSLVLAAVLMAFAVQTAWAEDEDDDMTPEIVLQNDTDEAEDDDAVMHPLRLGHPGHWRGRGHGPAMMPGMGGMGRRMGGGMGMGGKMGQGRDRAFGFFGMPMIRAIELTGDQKSQFIDAMVDVYRKRLTLRMEQDDLFQKLKNEHESEKPDHDTIVSLNRALGELKGRLDITGNEYFAKIQSILTPEQREKIKDNLDKLEKRMKDGRPGRGPKGGPKTMRGPGPRIME